MLKKTYKQHFSQSSSAHVRSLVVAGENNQGHMKWFQQQQQQFSVSYSIFKYLRKTVRSSAVFYVLFFFLYIYKVGFLSD